MADQFGLIGTLMEERAEAEQIEGVLGTLASFNTAELVAKVADLLRRVSALMQVYNQVANSLSLDSVLPHLVDIVTRALKAERGTLFLYDQDTEELFSRVVQGGQVGEIRIPAGAGIVGSVFKSGEPLLIADAYADARFNQEVDRRTGFRTRNILCAPLRDKVGSIVGATQVLNKRAGAFDAEDLSLLEAITAQAAAVLENARLFERVEKAHREEAQLLEVSSALSSELQLDSLLAKIMRATTEVLDADRSTLFLFDPKTSELWSRVAEGVNTKEIRFPSSAGIAGEAFTTGNTLNIPDAYADPRFNREVDSKTGYRTRSILCMPIVNKAGQRIGVTQVLNKRGGPFAATDEHRLRALSAQAAIAIENAQLFDDVLNVKNYNESILKSLSNGVITLDSEDRVIKANEAALRILKMSEEDIHNRTANDVFGAANAWVMASLRNVKASGAADLVFDTEMQLGDGSKVSINLTCVPLIDIKEESIGCMLIVEDISREKRIRGTMARYMTKEIVDKLLEEGESALGGSTQEVSILFSDIRQFTTISEQLGARGTVSLLNEYFSEMVDIIFAHNGILDKYIGDAIMAVFGTPFQNPADADNAVAVANEMLVKLRQLNRTRIDRGQAPIEIGVGIATGEVVAGNIGSPRLMNYTVIGDTVNLASRLEGATKFYGCRLLVSALTVEKTKDDKLYREIDLIRVKGKRRPVAIYEALDHHSAETFPNMAKTVAAFERGLRQYRGGDFATAIQSFQGALELHPYDQPSQIYLERSRLFVATPPPSDWDGVWTMAEK